MGNNRPPDQIIDPKRGPYFHIYSGKPFYFLSCKPEDFDIDDIAHSLSRINRFNGHSKSSFSVATHSLFVCDIVEKTHPEYALEALLHDATEAYVGDMVKPLKDIIPEFKKIEDSIWIQIAKRYDLERDLPDIVHKADMIALVTEVRDICNDPTSDWTRGIPVSPSDNKVYCETSEHAKIRFIDKYNELLVLRNQTKKVKINEKK